MKTKLKLIIVIFFTAQLTTAQTFFTEDFNSYSTGPLNTVYDDTTPGKGGWLVSRSTSGTSSIITGMVTPETGKGNILTIATTSKTIEGFGFKQERGFLATLWNNRTPGNNIFKFEFYGRGTFNFSGQIQSDSQKHVYKGFIATYFQSNYYYCILGSYLESAGSNWKSLVLENYNVTTFPYNMWIKAEMFVDFNNNNVYFYIPTLNTQVTAPFSHNELPFNLAFYVGSMKTSSIVKIDNIKVSGLKTLPSYILSVNQQLATKFNL
ncbi:hypothetical protein P3875_01855 [Myroides sp. JBRI-B21084]|uniref:hypothetical protein n=1 Tax=Myroides sp. JBRI-B21084 TaxID=3119977 RepID=UPI0026E3EB48|nr:hypothetical protein [Paenimyroides cloacae]WKW46842.1 hypothetical protein P3875_01855 [Paenimyroides cloacae]